MKLKNPAFSLWKRLHRPLVSPSTSLPGFWSYFSRGMWTMLDDILRIFVHWFRFFFDVVARLFF